MLNDFIVSLLYFIGFSGYGCAYYYYRKYKFSQKQPVHSISAEEILHDLTAHGVSLIKIERIDPVNILLRRPT